MLRQDPVLSQADALTKNRKGLSLQVKKIPQLVLISCSSIMKSLKKGSTPNCLCVKAHLLESCCFVQQGVQDVLNSSSLHSKSSPIVAMLAWC